MSANPSPDATLAVVRAFNDALNARDLPGMLACLTPDSVFENTYPPPDGSRHAGLAEVRAFWEQFFQGSSSARIEVEEIFACGERGVMRWTYHWQNPRGERGHIRGIDLYTLRGGLIAEKFSYVKG